MDSLYSLSFGAGVQSTALLLLTLNKDKRLYDALGGHFPDLAVFADTGAEPSFIYTHLQRMKKLCDEKDFRLDIVSAGDLGEDMSSSGFASAPLFTKTETGVPLRRQCTREYKITPIHKHIKRVVLDMKPRARMRHQLHTILGISVDEAGRAKDSRYQWETKEYPLLKMLWRRQECREYLESQGYPDIKKSACVFCPYRSAHEWREMKENHHKDFEQAITFDERTRTLHSNRDEKKRAQIFVHSSLEPLKDSPWESATLDLFDSWEDECDGVCGL